MNDLDELQSFQAYFTSIHSVIQSVIQYVISANDVPDIVVGAGDTNLIETYKVPIPIYHTV